MPYFLSYKTMAEFLMGMMEKTSFEKWQERYNSLLSSGEDNPEKKEELVSSLALQLEREYKTLG